MVRHEHRRLSVALRAEPDQARPRRVGVVRRTDQARSLLVLFSGRCRQGAVPGDGQAIYNNLNSGKPGANYQPDRSQDALTYTNLTRSINARITYQATQKNKFNIFWDEQLTCLDPCDGTVASWTTPESTWSGQVHPARLQQVSWTNPYTNRLLFEAGVSVNTQLYDYTHHRYAPGVSSIPRIAEFGETTGGDSVASRVNATAGTAFAGLTSGPLNSAMGSLGAAETRDLLDVRPRRLSVVRVRKAQRQDWIRRAVLQPGPKQSGQRPPLDLPL